MKTATNTPYVKRFHEIDGVQECGNPITKANPFVNDGSNRSNRKKSKERFSSNKKGISLVISKQLVPQKDGSAVLFISKVKKVRQYINSFFLVPSKYGVQEKSKRSGKSIEHYVLSK